MQFDSVRLTQKVVTDAKETKFCPWRDPLLNSGQTTTSADGPVTLAFAALATLALCFYYMDPLRVVAPEPIRLMVPCGIQ